MVDDEAEESGSDVNSDDDIEKDGELVIPEGIDIVERPSFILCNFMISE